MSTPIEIHAAVPGRAVLGESPRWDADRGRLLWVDVYGHSIHALEGSRERFWRGDAQVGCLAPTASDAVVAALADRLALIDLESGETVTLNTFEHAFLDMRANDGACDPAGRMWVGTMHRQLVAGSGTLYCRIGGVLQPRLEGVTLSNGIGWSPDATTMYFVDSSAQTLDAFEFDLDSAELGRRTTVATIAPRDGTPDGLAVDHDGCVWVALHGGGQVRRYTPRGDLDRTLALPTDKPSACCFGGPRGDTLFITTATMGMDEETLLSQPLAGAVLAAAVGVTGAPAVPFDPAA